MRLEWLEDILAVAETGSFQAAAERRLLSQPAFSRRLRAIETALGTELFDRSARPARLRPHVVDQVERMREAAAVLRGVGEGLRGGARSARRRLVIASQHAITTARAPDLIHQLAGLDLDVRLRSANRDECVTRLLTREADFALVYDVGETAPIAGREFLEAAAVGLDRLVPVFAADGAADLNAAFASGALPVVAYPEDVFLGIVQRKALFPEMARVCRIRTKLETALTPAALKCALAAIGVAWVPESLSADSVKNGALANLAGVLPSLDMKVLLMRVAAPEAAPDEAWAILSGGAPPHKRPSGALTS